MYTALRDAAYHAPGSRFAHAVIVIVVVAMVVVATFYDGRLLSLITFFARPPAKSLHPPSLFLF